MAGTFDIIIREMMPEDYDGVYQLWMSIKGFAMRSLDDSRDGVLRFLKRNPDTSVVAVEVAPDLKTCKVWVSVYGDEKAQADTLAGLQSAEGYIKNQLAKQINLRNTPELRFIVDESIAYGVRMSKLIDDVVKSDED